MPPYILLLAIVYGIALVAHDPIEPQKFFGQIFFLRSFLNIGNDLHRLVGRDPMVYLASISYMLYLIHLPMYFLVRTMITLVAGGLDQGVRYWIVSITTVVFSVAFSAASWRFYESPILKHKDRFTDWAIGRREKLSTVDTVH